MSAFSLENLISQKGVILLDGGMGTQLIERGLKIGECADAWNLDKPTEVEDIHRSYYEAGSMAVQTNTFGANPFILKKQGLEAKTREINLAGANIARKAAMEGKLVIGDIGPSGEFIAPLGDLTEDELYEGYLVQAKALVEGGVDLIHIETMSSIEEALAALKAAIDSGATAMSSMTYDCSKKGYFTSMGITPEKAVSILADGGAKAVGANCSIGPEEMTGLVEELKSYADLPVISQPNAGQPVLKDGDAFYDIKPSEFASFAPKLKAAGAAIIGGCCGTTPEFIREMKKALLDD